MKTADIIKTDLRGRKILVVGMGRSGIAAARLCAREGAEVTVTDIRHDNDIDTFMLEGMGIRKRFGGHDPEDFTDAELIVVSPGVPLDLKELDEAGKAGVPIIGEVELASGFLRGIPMIGITGTNGKSTTTALAGAMLSGNGRKTFVGGNIGRALSEAVLNAPPDIVVLELSSFQLETCMQLKPDIAVLLNFASDHLDRHGSFENYIEAKARLFSRQKSQDAAVLAGDDQIVMCLTPRIKAQKYYFGRKMKEKEGAVYCADEKGNTIIKIRLKGKETENYQIKAPSLRGPHNASNAAAAALASRIAGASPSAVQKALDSFPGLPHRLERIRIRNGVEWINDSKATNPDSARVALMSFPSNIIWIAGGRGKGVGYESLFKESCGRLKSLITIGEDAETLIRAAEGYVDSITDAKTMEIAVQTARKMAVAGDVALLSPACSSYDQFSDFEERGNVFRRLVEELP